MANLERPAPELPPLAMCSAYARERQPIGRRRVISPAEFEHARLAFVAGWEAADVARPSAPPGTRSGEGLAAALDSLGIIVADR